MFNTPLDPGDEQRFQTWVSYNKVPWRDSPTSDYDMRGFWKAMQAGDPIARTGVSPFDNQIHFPDRWKTPFHQTFSGESMYAQPGAPRWVDDKLTTSDGRILRDETPKPPLVPARPYGSTPLQRLVGSK